MNEKNPVSPIFLNLAFWLSMIALLAFLLAGPGSRFGWWHFRIGFSILKFGFYGAVLSLFLFMIGLYRNRKFYFSKNLIRDFPTLIISIILIVLPLKWVWMASHLPRIHDITTDFDHPPLFISVLPFRKEAPNSVVYGGAEIAVLQQKGYPDLGPLLLPLPPDQAFQKALMRAEEMGWKIVDANPVDKRIEATDTTFWFGFKDDIVIRVTPSNRGSRIDLRSLSRVGISDVGANARRIRNFLNKLSPKE